MGKSSAPSAAMHCASAAVLLLLLVLACCILQPSYARPLNPATGGGAQDADQCTTPGSCGNDDAMDDDSSDDEDSADYEDDDDGSPPIPPPKFQDDLLPVQEHTNTAELFKDLGDYFEWPGAVTSEMQRHLEKAHVTKTSSKNANGYATFGSLLDVSTISSSTWPGSTEFGNKVSWITSLLNRESLVGDGNHTPCTADQLQLSNDDEEDDPPCIIAATVEKYVSVRGDEDVLEEEIELAAEYGILSKGEFTSGNIMELELNGRKFDTIVANGVLAAVDEDTDENAYTMEDMDLVLERLVSFLNPGGSLYLIGAEPLEYVEGRGAIGREVMQVLESAKSLSGEYPKRNLPASWINRNLSRLGLNVYTSSLFPVEYDYEDMAKYIAEARDWIEELEDISDGFKKTYYKMLLGLEERVEEATRDGPIFGGEHTYIIGAQLP